MNLKTYLSKNPKKYLIFDLDRTLALLDVDWGTYRKELWALVATFDTPLTQEVPFEHLRGIELTNKAAKRHGEKAIQLLKSFNGRYELSHYRGYTPNPALVQFVKNNTEHTLFVWTNNQRATIVPFLEAEQIQRSFAKIITRDEVDFIKPDSEGFNYIFIPGSDKKDYLMIGDSFTDKGASEGAGIDFFLADYFQHN